MVECTLLNVNDVDTINDFAFKLKYFCSEFSELMSVSIAECGYVKSEILYLLLCCTELVISIHQSDIALEQPSPVPNSYNPPKYGRAYYFTKYGCQIRPMRRFNIDKGG